MTIGYIGLGKMGLNMVLRLQEKGHSIIAYNRSPEPRKEAQKKGVVTVATISELVSKLHAPRLIWIMVSHGGVDAVIEELLPLLSKGDIVVDGGNCFYKDTQRRAKHLKKHAIIFLDAGVSGGPAGARNGACTMVGGEAKDFARLEPLFKDISAPGAYLHCGGHGAGHFVKMVHNGIEYGMMQALGEGFEVLKASPFKLNLEKVAGIYNNRSVIESRLVGWLQDGFKKYGTDLKSINPVVAHTGEGAWTVSTAKELDVPAPIIKGSLDARKRSVKDPRYAGRVLSVLRNQFGGHDAGNKKR
jgi:6-phosphogluconate dehydrogenase